MEVAQHSHGQLTWEYANLKFDDHLREVLMLDVPDPATAVSTSCDMVADNLSLAHSVETSRARTPAESETVLWKIGSVDNEY